MSSHTRTCMLPLAALGVVFMAGQAAASGSDPFGITQAIVLKHLPAGRDELVFRGETARRSFSVYLARGEVDLTRTFQIGVKNTAALLPERSSLRLVVNGHVLAPVAVQSPNAVSIVPIAIPPGTLVSGLNRVEIEVVLAHRVDCSVAATYELWARLDPAQTGFLVPALAAAPVHAVEEVAGEAPAADGTTRILLRMPDNPDATAIARAARFVDALVARAGLSRPVVEVGTGPGSGPGFDVLLTTDRFDAAGEKDVRVVGHDDAITFARDSASRLTLVMSGSDGPDLDAQVAAFAGKAAPARATEAGQISIDGETRMSFADAGLRSGDFAGRHYAAGFGLTLPPDFYPANGEKGRVLIDGSYADNLDPGSELALRVNGTLVSTLDLAPSRGGVLRHEVLELPLRSFHPGHNDVVIEGVMTTPRDRQCDAAGAAVPVRFSLAESSEFEIPGFARVATAPQIPGALSALQSIASPVHLYLLASDAISVGSGLTVLANAASRDPEAMMPVVHLGSPAWDDPTGIVVGPWSALPAPLSAPIRGRLQDAVSPQPAATPDPDRKPVVPAKAAARSPSPLAESDFQSFDPADWIDRFKRFANGRRAIDPQALLDKADRLLQRQGYFFKAADAGKTVPFTPRTLLVAAADPRVQGRKFAGFDIPNVVVDPAQWLVVTASDPTVLKAGLDRMISDGHWGDLQGEAVSFDLDKGTFAAVQPSRVLYVRPDHIALGDIRPILGGLVSSDIELSLAVLVLLMTLLGISTHVIVRRIGAK